MSRTKTLTALIISSTMSFAMTSSHAADPVATDTAAHEVPAKPETTTNVVKTKTKSNQSNDRQANSASGKDASTAAQSAAVVKTKTKSNQSND